MPKFPDPTKDYGASPVAGAIDANKLPPAEAPKPAPEPVYTAPIQHEPSSTGKLENGNTGAPKTVVGSSPFRNLIPVGIGLAAITLLIVLVSVIVPMFSKKTT